MIMICVNGLPDCRPGFNISNSMTSPGSDSLECFATQKYSENTSPHFSHHSHFTSSDRNLSGS